MTGSIINGTLVATEVATVSGHRKRARSALDDPMALPCTWRYEAPRVPETVDQAPAR